MATEREEALLADTNAPICAITSADAFSSLSREEKLYTHHMCRASFKGTRILLNQTSHESEGIYDWIVSLYNSVEGDWVRLSTKQDVNTTDLEHFLEYAAMFLGNVGNYRSTGDTKFIPRVGLSVLQKLSEINDTVKEQFSNISEAMYSTTPSHYGFPDDDQCASGYYPSPYPISESDVETVDKALFAAGILPENTRITREAGEGPFVVHIAASSSSWQPIDASSSQALSKSHELSFEFRVGDHAAALGMVVQELNKAKNYVTGQVQNDMLEALITSFTTGDHRKFKEAQTHWVKDKAPVVESVIGFIETYQDPHGIRGAWEGIIAIVNKAQSAKFNELVERSSEFIVTLPWNGKCIGLDPGTNSAYETLSFIKPDFTSLDTIGFLKSESPAGLNLPNFEDICQTIGSKNLEFGNVNNANPPNEEIPFIRDEDIGVVRAYREKAFEILVACHELLGHGSGRLFSENEQGDCNFSQAPRPTNPFNGEEIDTWYKAGQTWASVFGGDANALEECRADGVSLILLPDQRVLRIFGFTDEEALDIVYAGYLNFFYGTIKGLPRWNPETKKWGQSHQRGKFALLRCLLEAAPEVIQIEEQSADIKLAIDRTKIISHAVPALQQFLLRLQVYKSTANAAEGIPWFDRYCQVDDTFARYRKIVLHKRTPRIQYVQPNTFLLNDEVIIREYPATKEGLIQSWVERDV